MTSSTHTISPLRQRMIDDMRMRKLSPKTQASYIRVVKRFAGFLGRSADASVICVKGYTSTVRNVPDAVKEQAFSIYGITSRKPKEYEIDHLISLELGGSNSIRNLWPQSYITKPLNAHVKDKLV